MEKYNFKHKTIFAILTFFNAIFLFNIAYAQTDITSVSGGSANIIPKYDNTFSIATSNIYDDGTMIGFNTQTPVTGLHLFGTSYNQSSLILERQETYAYGGSLFFRSRKSSWGAIGNGIYIGTIVFQGSKASSGNYGSGAAIQATTTQIWTDNATGGKLHLQTTANGSTTPTTRLAIEQNGYVGIGTTSPDAILHVNGSSGTTVKIVDGNQGAGKILTSDANGVASWSTPVSGVAWSLTGNSGTTAGTNFLGTTDAVDLVFKVNNVKSGLIDDLGATFFGYQAGYNNVEPTNTGFGYKSLYSISSSNTYNTAIGYNALPNNTCSNNTAAGALALYSNSSGSGNTAVGTSTLYNNTAGNYSTSVGGFALAYNTSSNNAALGYEALFRNTSGSNNTAIGYQTLNTNTSTSYNTALGYRAGYTYQNQTYNTYIGCNADQSSNNLSGATAIGYNATTNANNRIYIGTSANSQNVGGYDGWQQFSDRRFKENIQENVPGLSFITKLHPVIYNVNTEKYDEFMGIKQRMDTINDVLAQDSYYQRLNEVSLERRTGFIAQEVDSIAQIIGYNFDGVHVPSDTSTDNYTISYAAFVVPLVKAIQEQQLMIDSLKQQMRITDSLLIALQNCCLQGSKNIIIPDNSSQMQNKSENTVQIELTNSNQPVLYQNEPNPFGNNTVIRYFIPENFDGNAFILFYDMFGNEIKSTEITDTGFGNIIVNTENLAAGIYSYCLILNNKIIETKKMIRKK